MVIQSSTKQNGEATTEEAPGSIVTYTGEEISSCLDTRQPGTVFKKLDTRQSEILTNFLEMAGSIPLRT